MCKQMQSANRSCSSLSASFCSTFATFLPRVMRSRDLDPAYSKILRVVAFCGAIVWPGRDCSWPVIHASGGEDLKSFNTIQTS